MTGAQSYNKTDARESLLSFIKDVSPNTDNYFVTTLGQAPDATNTLHEWGVYNTARPTSITFTAEGSAVSYSDLTTPTKSNNRIALIDEPVRVSTTSLGIDSITGQDSYAFHKGEALKRLKAKMEYATINGTYATGSSGVAAGMAGIDGCISTNVTARTSGTSFTATEFENIVQDSYDQVGSEYIADTFVCPMVIKRRIVAASSEINTRVMAADEKKVDGDIRLYDSAVGPTVKIIPHKDVRAVNGTLTVYLLKDNLFAHSFLAGEYGSPRWDEFARDGHRVNGAYSTQLTMVSFAQRASVKRTGYNGGL